MSILSFAVAWRRSYLLGIQSKPAKEEDINSTENGKVSNKQQQRQDQDSIFKNQKESKQQRRNSSFLFMQINLVVTVESTILLQLQ